MYLGNLAHTSYRSDEQRLNAGNVSRLEQLWRTPLHSPIASGITVSGGVLYFGAWDGNFYALRATDGAVIWKRFVGVAPEPDQPSCQPGIGVSSQAVVSGDSVYVGGGDAAVYALDRGTGEVRWRVPLADPKSGAYLWSSMMLSRDALYVGIASLGDCPQVRGGLARIRLDNPQDPLLRYVVPEGWVGGGIWGTPAIDEQAGLVYVTTGDAEFQDAGQGVWGSALLALDATTLAIKAYFFAPLRPTDGDIDFGTSPMLFETPDGGSYVAANGKDGVLYVLRRSDLTLAWSFKLAAGCVAPEQGCGSVSTPGYNGRHIITGAGQNEISDSPGSIYAIDPSSQSALWTRFTPGIVLAPVTLTPGLVFAATTQGLLVLHAGTGEVLWSEPGEEEMYGQAVVANGVLYSSSAGGYITAWGIPDDVAQDGFFADPDRLVFAFTSGGPLPKPQTVTVDASAGSLDITLASDAAWLTLDKQSGTTPVTAAVSVSPAGLDPGVHTGKITLVSAGGALSVEVRLVVNSALPTLDPRSVVNGASFETGALAPGSLFSILGSGLAAETVSVTSTPWPKVLSGVTVRVNGIPAPLGYLSPTQINAQMPYEIRSGTAGLLIESNGTSTGPVSVSIAPAAPGIFLLGGGQRAAAANQDWSLNTAHNPAVVGSVLAIFLTGQGELDHPVGTGDAAPFSELCSTLADTSATIGGQEAPVLFSGLAPRFLGLGQVNVKVPDLESGDYPVRLTIGGATSNPGLVSIRRDRP
jgi:uncharacterized protein (TIGR03437 family)